MNNQIAGEGEQSQARLERKPRSEPGLVSFLRLFARNRNAVFGVGILLLFVLLALFGSYLTPYDPMAETQLDQRLQGPSSENWLGTDDVGRDMLTRIAYGGRFSLFMGVAAVTVAAGIGVPFGLLAGYRGGAWDTGMMRIIDVMLALPTVVLSIALVTVMGTGITSVIIAVGVVAIPQFARLTRGVTLSLREQEYITAARVVGASDSRVLAKHLFPNTIPPIIVQASLGIGWTILVASALGFLGVGVQPPTPEWGAMLSRGREFITLSPHLALFPGLAISLVVLGFNLLGDGLRDALDPRLKQSV